MLCRSVCADYGAALTIGRRDRAGGVYMDGTSADRRGQLGAGMALLAAIGFLVKSAKGRVFGPNPLYVPPPDVDTSQSAMKREAGDGR